MKTEQELYAAILKITMKIKNQFPELSKYILEMSETIPNLERPKINCSVLQEYYESLCYLLKDYLDYHLKTVKLVSSHEIACNSAMNTELKTEQELTEIPENMPIWLNNLRKK